jgi:hypothetical protein
MAGVSLTALVQPGLVTANWYPCASLHIQWHNRWWKRGLFARVYNTLSSLRV